MSINHWLHELADPWDCVVRDLGEGSVRLLCWGSVNANPAYLVRLYGSGRLVVVDQADLTIAGNPGDPRDVPPKGRKVIESGVVPEAGMGYAPGCDLPGCGTTAGCHACKPTQHLMR